MAENECQGCRDGLLRKELSVKEWHDEYLKLAIYAVSLVDENVKLRELVKQIYPKAKAFLQIGVQLGCNDSLSYDWYQQLRELRVEVDDGTE